MVVGQFTLRSLRNPLPTLRLDLKSKQNRKDRKDGRKVLQRKTLSVSKLTHYPNVQCPMSKVKNRTTIVFLTLDFGLWTLD